MHFYILSDNINHVCCYQRSFNLILSFSSKSYNLFWHLAHARDSERHLDVYVLINCDVLYLQGNKSEYLSLVSLSTNPPHVSHGAGPTIDDSHDQVSSATVDPC